VLSSLEGCSTRNGTQEQQNSRQVTKKGMAQDNPRSIRQRATDGYGRSPGGPPPQNNDPLAELARLIGQSDPFADFSRKEPHEGDQAVRSTPQAAPEPAAREQRHFLEPRLVEQEPPEWRAPMPQEPVRLSPRPLQSIFPERYQEPAEELAHFRDDGGEGQDLPAFNPAVFRNDPDPHEQAQAALLPTDESDPLPAYDEEMESAPAEELYGDDPAPARRRGGIVALLAVLGLAVVGTAGAFGYRAVFGNSGPIGPPPVIHADQTPTKVVPAPQANESASSKFIYDRVGNRGQSEKVVAREEQPMIIKAPPPSGLAPALAAAPPPGAFPSPGAPISAIQAGRAPNPAAVLTEPKRIRTVTIRPDRPVAVPEIAATRPSPAGPPPHASSAPPPLPPPAPAAAPEPPREVTTTRSVSRFPAAAPEAPSAREPARPAPRASNPPPANAPLSLVPPSAGPQPSRVASAPTNLRPSAAASGGFTVQVTSQRSEAEAQSAFRSLQTRFPTELGGREAIIRRADIGGRGTFYRAQVGPFATAEAANAFCGSLKAAGGQCIIQRN
jgi:hypothetical protein